MNVIKPVFLLIFFISSIFFLSKDFFFTDSIEGYPHSFFTMSTQATVTLYCQNQKMANKGFKIVENKFKEIVSACNVYDSESKISKINQNSYSKDTKCSPLIWELLNISKKFYEISDYSFDVTAGPLIKQWGFYKKQNKLPSAQDIIKAKSNVGFNNIIIKKDKIRFNKKGIKIDFGGIAKGFAIDKAIEELERNGFKSGFINLGGNIRTLSKLPKDKENFKIGIKNPKDKNRLLGTIKIKDNSISTSGNYERYVTINGKRYTHIINPKTGMPVEGMLSVTVVTPFAVEADALSTAIFINGAEFAKKLKGKYPNINILIISEKDNKIIINKIGDIWDNITTP